MSATRLMLCIGLLGLLALGCNREEQKTAPATPSGASTPQTPAIPKVDMSAASNATTSQAQSLLDQATQYIKENKLDLAQKAVDQADKMRPSLPESVQKQIDTVKGMLANAKTAAAANIPGGPTTLPSVPALPNK